MIELVILNYLADQLGVPVGMEVPESTEGSFVVLEKTSSGKRNHICTAVFAIQSYGPTLLEAASLNEQVKTAMDSLTALHQVAACRLNSDYNYTDTQSKRYRYQAVYDITHY